MSYRLQVDSSLKGVYGHGWEGAVPVLAHGGIREEYYLLDPLGILWFQPFSNTGGDVVCTPQVLVLVPCVACTHILAKLEHSQVMHCQLHFVVGVPDIALWYLNSLQDAKKNSTISKVILYRKKRTWERSLLNLVQERTDKSSENIS